MGLALSEGLGISALGVNVEPWTPRSYKPIFLEEALRDGVVSKIIAIRETYRIGYESKWASFTWKDVFNTPAELTRCRIRFGLVMFWVSCV
ncbi:hypothetical protein RA210_U470002 [Rubrivivax sp. A210]|nr:hypothetical protein RA210_U470002 [Rubrivivax sp. A210]